MNETINYMSYCDQYLAHGNKLQAAVKDFIRSVDRKILNEDEAEHFQKFVKSSIEELNQAHPRCTPIKVEFIKGGNREDIIMDGTWFLVRFKLLACDYFYTRNNEVPNE